MAPDDLTTSRDDQIRGTATATATAAATAATATATATATAISTARPVPGRGPLPPRAAPSKAGSGFCERVTRRHTPPVSWRVARRCSHFWRELSAPHYDTKTGKMTCGCVFRCIESGSSTKTDKNEELKTRTRALPTPRNAARRQLARQCKRI